MTRRKWQPPHRAVSPAASVGLRRSVQTGASHRDAPDPPSRSTRSALPPRHRTPSDHPHQPPGGLLLWGWIRMPPPARTRARVCHAGCELPAHPTGELPALLVACDHAGGSHHQQLGAAVALAGLTLHGQRIVHRDVGDLRRDVADLRERMAKLEGAVGMLTRFLIDRERGCAPRSPCIVAPMSDESPRESAGAARLGPAPCTTRSASGTSPSRAWPKSSLVLNGQRPGEDDAAPGEDPSP